MREGRKRRGGEEGRRSVARLEYGPRNGAHKEDGKALACKREDMLVGDVSAHKLHGNLLGALFEVCV